MICIRCGHHRASGGPVSVRVPTAWPECGAPSELCAVCEGEVAWAVFGAMVSRLGASRSSVGPLAGVAAALALLRAETRRTAPQVRIPTEVEAFIDRHSADSP
jgi:hypothetical protein